jgi:prepilin-type N-terminal cleavage/methylation domain-containing protein
VSSTPSKPTSDDGFTLVELVMAIVVLFIAMAAATQIIVTMVSATIANRHVDLAMSVATQAMESSVAYDCGGQLLDPATVPGETNTAKLAATQLFYSKLQKRCLIDTNSASPTAKNYNIASCDAAGDVVKGANDPFNVGFLPTFDQLQNDLGSRRFTVLKSAASFQTAADGSATSAGTLSVCTTLRLTWKFVKSVGVNTIDDGSNNGLRLQRSVHVQWFEPRQSVVRSRDLTQVSALPPDSKVAVNQGRISVVPGVGKKSATIKMLNSDPAVSATYAADELTGLVIFPFLPDGDFEVSIEGSPPLNVTLSDASAGRSVCLKSNGSYSKFLTGTCT